MVQLPRAVPLLKVALQLKAQLVEVLLPKVPLRLPLRLRAPAAA